MITPSYFLFYVDRPEASAAFYSELLGLAPVELSPTFALFALPAGVKLGFWSRHTVAPASPVTGGGGEMAFALPDPAAVGACCAKWRDCGLAIIQEPVAMDFGFTFVALDPDGHRLRVFAPAAA